MSKFVKCIDNSLTVLDLNMIYELTDYQIDEKYYNIKGYGEFYRERFIEINENNMEETKMNKKLEIELYRYENLVFGKIIYQDDSLLEKVSYENGDFKIESVTSPSLLSSMLYIRGSEKKFDNEVFKRAYCSEKEAIEICEKIRLGVDTINNSVEEKNESKIIKII